MNGAHIALEETKPEISLEHGGVPDHRGRYIGMIHVTSDALHGWKLLARLLIDGDRNLIALTNHLIHKQHFWGMG